jgi:hypothetical protein
MGEEATSTASASAATWTSGDVPSVIKGCVGIGCYALAGFLSIPYAVRLWWAIVNYDGDMPFWTIVLLERINLLFMGAIPFGLAIALAVMRGHLRRLSATSVVAYSTGAGVLWEGVPLVLSAATGPLGTAAWAAGLIVLTLTYYGLVVGLARLRHTHAAVVGGRA